jgi:hypothetical protein
MRALRGFRQRVHRVAATRPRRGRGVCQCTDSLAHRPGDRQRRRRRVLQAARRRTSGTPPTARSQAQSCPATESTAQARRADVIEPIGGSRLSAAASEPYSSHLSWSSCLPATSPAMALSPSPRRGSSAATGKIRHTRTRLATAGAGRSNEPVSAESGSTTFGTTLPQD